MKNPKLKLILTITTLFISSTTLLVQLPSHANREETEVSQTKKRKSTWERIVSLFTDKERTPLGSRGVCLVSPGILEKTDKIWHNQPSFVLGTKNSEALKVRLLEVRLYSKDNARKPFWRKKITSDSSSLEFKEIVYQGKLLQQGQRYDWEIFDSIDKNKYRQSFTVMAMDEYNSIAEDLKEIETQLSKQRMSEEQIILAKADYFAQKGLFSDALIQMASIKNPSLEFKQQKESLLADLCITPE